MKRDLILFKKLYYPFFYKCVRHILEKKSTNNYRSALCLFLFCFVFSISAFGQQKYASMAEMKAALAEAKKYQLAKEGDNVLLITEPLIEQLKKDNLYNSSFGFQVRLVQAHSLYYSSKEVNATEALWELRDESEKYEEWYVYASICMEVAWMQGTGEQSEKELEHLQFAKKVIDKYDFKDLYGDYCIRYSSWSRLYGNSDTAYLYAQRAIENGEKMGILRQEAEGYLLLSLVLYYDKEDLTISDTINKLELSNIYAKKAAIRYKKYGDLLSFVSMHTNIARTYNQVGDYQKAINHIDSILPYAAKFHRRNRAARANKTKAESLKNLGQLDSALVYFQKAHKLEIEVMQNDINKQFREIDKKYNVDKKNQELTAEQTKSNLLIGFIVLAVIFAGVLTFYLLRLRKANTLVKQQATELKNLDELKSTFFANISHELRTPLTLMLAPIDTAIKGNALRNRELRLLQTAKQSGQQLLKLINSILDLTKLEANKLQLHKTSVSLFQFSRRMLAMFESYAKNQGVNLRFEYQAPETLVIETDKKKLETILSNLLSNALKFTPPDGEVLINIKETSSQIVIQVKDTGRGIHPEDLTNVFNRFYQTKQPNAAAEGGTGIGLALVKEIVTLLEGKIEVESKLNQGTTFTVSIPRIEVAEPSIIEESIEEKNPDLDVEAKEIIVPTIIQPINNHDILIVEDNLVLRNFIKSLLSNHKVRAAKNGQEALKMIGEKQPDMIISDVMMPIMDGFQLLEQLKSNDKLRHIPTLMLTARASKTDKLKALRIGVDDYMTKPFEQDELYARVNNLLKNVSERSKWIKEVEPELDMDTSIKQQEPEMSNRDREWLEEVENLVEKQLSNINFNTNALAHEIAISRTQLFRKFKKLTGLSPSQYIQEVRLKKAYELFENNTYDSVKAVALSVGIKHRNSFATQFKTRFGKLPSELL